MNTWKRHRFPQDIISYAVWLYYRFYSIRQARRFLHAHAAVSNLFNLARHLVRAEQYMKLRMIAFAERSRVVA